MVLVFYLIQYKTGYHYHKFKGIVREHDPLDWPDAFHGTLSVLPILLLTFLLIFGITEYKIQKKNDKTI
jgi:hypothetical protein